MSPGSRRLVAPRDIGIRLLVSPATAPPGSPGAPRPFRTRQTPVVHPDGAALESIATGLEQLTERLVGIADARRHHPDDLLVAQLDDLERTLRGTHRRLTRTIRSL